MKMTLSRILLSTVIILVLATNGLAVSFFLDDDISDNRLVSNRESLSGSFGIPSSWSQFARPDARKNLTGGTLHFSFTDNDDLINAGFFPQQWERTVEEDTVLFGRNCFETFRDSFEMVRVDALGKRVSRQTGYRTQITNSDRPDDILVYETRGPFDYVYQTQYFNRTMGWGGDIDFSMNVDSYWLGQLLDNGFLQYNLSAYMGDLIFKSARLELDFASDPSPVPEPSTFLLLSAGFLLLGKVRAGVRRIPGKRGCRRSQGAASASFPAI
ncbi:hypothetical protein DSCA_47330 [Desulfosarcina alkanivorans]|jgi:hypothetical protein|uniref:Ice-binding protein C-terminal domain-containing protein n=1 Tax=Desulfosarcina alkanivorans TaxID=571177 RepID=A0A5K7YR97_9BACT|nr:PEP-CTERM sorting domain-containing protein [Desulfosarcina alkanivorans]BBO70803.1 hypothetical protein DSCA_47330 [Desulfosarcina alkanivorans]